MNPQYCFEEFTSVFSPPKGPMIGLWLLPRMEGDQGLFFVCQREGITRAAQAGRHVLDLLSTSLS